MRVYYKKQRDINYLCKYLGHKMIGDKKRFRTCKRCFCKDYWFESLQKYLLISHPRKNGIIKRIAKYCKNYYWKHNPAFRTWLFNIKYKWLKL